MTAMTPGRRVRLFGLAAVVAAAVAVPLLPAEGAPAAGPTPHQRQLTAQVEDPAGVPRAGSDPAARRQTSLAAAASRRQGTGTRTDRPAAGVRTGKVVPQAPAAAAPGVTSGGCLLGYGQPGAQCVPARGPQNTKLTCGYVRLLFPDGIRVTGVDRLRLDTDRDGTACGPRDAGVPPPVTRPPSVTHPHD